MKAHSRNASLKQITERIKDQPMYQFPYFKDSDQQSVMALMETYPFALVTGCDASGRMQATQIPLLTEWRDGGLILQGHVMRHTDHCRAWEDNPSVMAVFTGPNAYVSATWYSNPHAGSTWNYMTVQVRGNLRFMDDAALGRFMERMTLKFESEDPSSPTVFSNLPETYRNNLLPAISGFEIHVESLEHTFKLSQNRDARSYRNIMTKLETKGCQEAEIAREMRKRMARLFPQEPE